jgi:hypothetical protein
MHCGSGIQPDHFYKVKGGYDVGEHDVIKNRMINDKLEDTNGPVEGYIAGVMRWSTRGGEGNVVIDRDNPYIVKVRTAVVPEPCTMLLMGAGLAGLAGIARRRRKS